MRSGRTLLRLPPLAPPPALPELERRGEPALCLGALQDALGMLPPSAAKALMPCKLEVSSAPSAAVGF